MGLKITCPIMDDVLVSGETDEHADSAPDQFVHDLSGGCPGDHEHADSAPDQFVHGLSGGCPGDLVRSADFTPFYALYKFFVLMNLNFLLKALILSFN